MAIVIQRSQLTEADKQFIRQELAVTSNTDPVVTIKPFRVVGEDVWLPFAFYSELREFGKHDDWPVYPNDALHPQRFAPEWKFKGELREYQIEVWRETLPILQARHCWLGQLACGWGKSIFTAYIASKIQLITLILYHVSPLGRSWPKTFEEFSNATVCHIGHDRFDPEAQIYIATVGAALSDKFPLDPNRVGVLVIDEMHCFSSSCRIFSLLRFTPKYLLMLTATPDKANGLGKLINIFGGRLKVDENGQPIPGQVPTSVIRISEKPFAVYRCNTNFRPRIKSGPGGKLDWQEVKNSLLPHSTDPTKSTPQSKLITKLICDWATMNPHKKILITCIQISQVKAIAEELQSRGEDVGVLYGNMSTYDECRVLVANVQKIGVGFDDSMTCRNYGGRRFNMIILGFSHKDPSTIEQIVGRMRGINGVVIDIVHSFPSFTKHYKNRLEWYLSRKGTIHESNVPITIPDVTCTGSSIIPELTLNSAVPSTSTEIEVPTPKQQPRPKLIIQRAVNRIGN